MTTFEEAWAKKEAEGYQYGEDALVQVRFGWEIAHQEMAGLEVAARELATMVQQNGYESALRRAAERILRLTKG